ncbi:rRNA-processing protein las1 [Ascochyta clinopodiicola]|nr:rRNA-processing protein las1 [Ascochyta clinopodiicola]
MPSLAELKRAAKDALSWLWEWYWAQLDLAFGLPSSVPTNSGNDMDAASRVRDNLQTILRTYIKTRKQEIKSKRSPHLCTAARNALSTSPLRPSSSVSTTALPASTTQDALLHLLVQDSQILPADKKSGSTMSGAFLVWDPLLLALSAQSPAAFTALLDAVLRGMRGGEATAAVREGLCEWAAHMLTSSEWAGVRRGERALREKVLGECLTELGVWDLRLAERVVGGMGAEGELWRAILDASKSDEGGVVRGEVGGEKEKQTEGDMEVEVEMKKVVEPLPKVVPTPVPAPRSNDVREKIRGPQKVVGLWKPKPIGWLPDGWDEDA